LTKFYGSQKTVILMHASFMATSGQEQTLACFKERRADVSTGACSVFWRAIETK
jgi:hypothetical protein